MRRFKVFILCLCFALTASELLGPDARQEEAKEAEEEAQDDEAKDNLDWKEMQEAVYHELSVALNEKLLTFKEYADALRSTKDMKVNQLKQMEFTLKLLKSSLMKNSKLSYEDLKIAEQPDNEIDV